MALELIGAGLGRTGTLSLKSALERIGYGPCYHMIEVLAAPERARHWLEKTQSGAHDWDAIFRGYRATVDWPAAAFWRELAVRYPAAKVLFSLRDADRWYDSVMNTIYQVMTQPPPERAPETIHDFHKMVYALVFERTFGTPRRSRARQARLRGAQPGRDRCDPGLAAARLSGGRRLGAALPFPRRARTGGGLPAPERHGVVPFPHGTSPGAAPSR